MTRVDEEDIPTVVQSYVCRGFNPIQPQHVRVTVKYFNGEESTINLLEEMIHDQMVFDSAMSYHFWHNVQPLKEQLELFEYENVDGVPVIKEELPENYELELE